MDYGGLEDDRGTSRCLGHHAERILWRTISQRRAPHSGHCRDLTVVSEAREHLGAAERGVRGLRLDADEGDGVPEGFRCHHVHEEDGAVLGTEDVRARLETEAKLHVVLERRIWPLVAVGEMVWQLRRRP